MSFILTAYLKIKSPVGSFFAKLFIFLYNKGQYERGADLKELITGPEIKISGLMKRHKIVQKVVNTFIKTEHRKKGKGVSFRYPVERMPCGIL